MGIRLNTLSILVLATFLVGCSESKFSSAEKEDFLSKTSAIGPDGSVDVDQTSSTEAGVEVRRVCSDDRSKASGNVIAASKVVLVVTSDESDEGVQLCMSNTKDYKSDLINNKKFLIGAGCSLADGKYTAKLFDPTFLAAKKKELAKVEFEVKKGALQYKSDKLEVIYHTNPKKKSGGNDVNVMDADHEDCDTFASPLVVKLKEDKAIELSSPIEGIQFDILGQMNNHEAKQISWPVNAAMAFITLPDASGSVHSIDQLFGDNTTGPDGEGSANGYEALAKFDRNRDGRIDKKDRVYSKLRLWIDFNRDGRSQASELRTLQSQKIESIDLEYDAHYKETDKYGNEILYKSVATKTDGSMLLVFDIWFRLID